MTSCLADFLVGTDGLSRGTLSRMMEPALIVGQALKWLPAWLTPLWVIALGLMLGAIVSAAVYGVLALLSFVPGLGTLADSPRRGVIASLVVGGVIALGLCVVYVSQSRNLFGVALFAADLHRTAGWLWFGLRALASNS